MCEVYGADGKPHPTNTPRFVKTAKKYAKHECLFGIEQEYTFFKDGRPLRLPRSAASRRRRGGYYCGVGTDEIFGREIVEAHLDNCIDAGLTYQRHQRRGDDRPVGVPDRPARPARGRRPAVGRPLAAVPHRRGLRRVVTSTPSR